MCFVALKNAVSEDQPALPLFYLFFVAVSLSMYYLACYLPGYLPRGEEAPVSVFISDVCVSSNERRLSSAQIRTIIPLSEDEDDDVSIATTTVMLPNGLRLHKCFTCGIAVCSNNRYHTFLLHLFCI